MNKFLLLVSFSLSLTSCQTMYYSFWDVFGFEKRDLLKSNVKSLKDEQNETKETFRDALERLKKQNNIKNSSMDRAYAKVKDDYEDAEKSAEVLRDRVENIEEIAEDLFSEWRDEISQIQNRSYRSRSQTKLNKSKQRYDLLSKQMNVVLKSLEAPLQALKDKMLFMKHNLNAQSLDVFSAEGEAIEGDVAKLIQQIERANRSADDFLRDESFRQS